MRHRIALAVFVLLLAAVGSPAVTSVSSPGYVVGVDLAAKTITFKLKLPPSKEWKQYVATWNDKTLWVRAEVHDWDETPATEDLVKHLKKDDKVYVTLTDEPGPGKYLLFELKTLPADLGIG
jgi:hypothetical protein